MTEVDYNTSNVAGFNKTSTKFTYDAGNRLVTLQDTGTGSTGDTITRTYDGLDGLLSESYSSPGLSGTVSYTYDAARRRTSMTVSGQSQTSYGYDNANRLRTITRGGQTVSISVDADGRRTSLALPNGVTVAYTYDGDSHVKSITYSSTGGGSLGNLTYGYDANGRVVTMDGSLAGVRIPAPMTASYDGSNQLASWNGITASSDSRGNLTYDPTNAASYTWNERNQLASAAAGTGSSSFGYDALGRRVSRTSGGVTTQYLYDGLNVARELSTAGNAELLSGLGVDDWFGRTQSSATVAMLRDALGSTIGLVNAGGAIATSYGYEPFGATAASGAASSNSCQFTGREQDPTGLYYLRNRYYNPMLGRFLSPDPIGIAAG
jgi:RHS repeat-associated protein